MTDALDILFPAVREPHVIAVRFTASRNPHSSQLFLGWKEEREIKLGRALHLDRVRSAATHLLDGEAPIEPNAIELVEQAGAAQLDPLELTGSSAMLAGVLHYVHSRRERVRRGLATCVSIWATGVLDEKGHVRDVGKAHFDCKVAGFLRSPASVFLVPEWNWTTSRYNDHTLVEDTTCASRISELCLNDFHRFAIGDRKPRREEKLVVPIPATRQSLRFLCDCIFDPQDTTSAPTPRIGTRLSRSENAIRGLPSLVPSLSRGTRNRTVYDVDESALDDALAFTAMFEDQGVPVAWIGPYLSALGHSADIADIVVHELGRRSAARIAAEEGHAVLYSLSRTDWPSPDSRHIAAAREVIAAVGLSPALVAPRAYLGWLRLKPDPRVAMRFAASLAQRSSPTEVILAIQILRKGDFSTPAAEAEAKSLFDNLKHLRGRDTLPAKAIRTLRVLSPRSERGSQPRDTLDMLAVDPGRLAEFLRDIDRHREELGAPSSATCAIEVLHDAQTILDSVMLTRQHVLSTLRVLWDHLQTADFSSVPLARTAVLARSAACLLRKNVWEHWFIPPARGSIKRLALTEAILQEHSRSKGSDARAMLPLKMLVGYEQRRCGMLADSLRTFAGIRDATRSGYDCVSWISRTLSLWELTANKRQGEPLGALDQISEPIPGLRLESDYVGVMKSLAYWSLHRALPVVATGHGTAQRDFLLVHRLLVYLAEGGDIGSVLGIVDSLSGRGIAFPVLAKPLLERAYWSSADTGWHSTGRVATGALFVRRVFEAQARVGACLLAALLRLHDGSSGQAAVQELIAQTFGKNPTRKLLLKQQLHGVLGRRDEWLD